MPATSRQVKRWYRGRRLTASNINETVDALNDYLLDGPKGVDGLDLERGGERWRATNKTTQTIRVTNPDDSSIYIDVERWVTVTYQTPRGIVVLDHSAIIGDT